MKNTKLGLLLLKLLRNIMEIGLIKKYYVLRMKRKAEREKRLRAAYLEYFRQNPITIDVRAELQKYLAKTAVNGPAIQAAIETLAERGDYDLIAKSLEDMNRIHPSILATIGRYQKECAVLSAYT